VFYGKYSYVTSFKNVFNGNISVKSIENIGTNFTISIATNIFSGEGV